MNMSSRWNDLIVRAGAVTGPVSQRWLDIIIASYGDPRRHYHNLSHIESSLDLFEEYKHLASTPIALEFSILMHDVIYDAIRKDNELQSAVMATAMLNDLSLGMIAGSVYTLIMSTRHQAKPTDIDSQILCDIDLSILGADTNTYDAYTKAIRKEYAWVEEDAYRLGRANVLESFLEMRPIFQIKQLQDRYETQALTNIQREIQVLKGIFR
ncbi:N-methyl-D-aspartate receptor NMDAR2C subunit [Pseudomonas luteola]